MVPARAGRGRRERRGVWRSARGEARRRGWASLRGASCGVRPALGPRRARGAERGVSRARAGRLGRRAPAGGAAVDIGVGFWSKGSASALCPHEELDTHHIRGIFAGPRKKRIRDKILILSIRKKRRNRKRKRKNNSKRCINILEPRAQRERCMCRPSAREHHMRTPLTYHIAPKAMA